MAPVSGACSVGGYTLANIPDGLTPRYNGMILGTATTLCTNGYFNGSECVSYTSGDCDTNYYDLALNANTFSDMSGGTCPNSYSTYTATTRCDHNPGDTCVDLPTPIINITWNDGSGNEQTTTCTYEDQIVLPETPTRTGYNFAGWVVSSQ